MQTRSHHSPWNSSLHHLLWVDKSSVHLPKWSFYHCLYHPFWTPGGAHQISPCAFTYNVSSCLEALVFCLTFLLILSSTTQNPFSPEDTISFTRVLTFSHCPASQKATKWSRKITAPYCQFLFFFQDHFLSLFSPTSLFLVSSPSLFLSTNVLNTFGLNLMISIIPSPWPHLS